jgi:hypothetical protein
VGELKGREYAGFQNVSEREFLLEGVGVTVFLMSLFTFVSFIMFDPLSVAIMFASLSIYNHVSTIMFTMSRSLDKYGGSSLRDD